MLDITMYTGKYATGRTYQALTDAIQLASQRDDKVPVVLVSNEHPSDISIKTICSDLKIEPTSVDVIIVNDDLSNLSIRRMRELELDLPVEMIVVIDSSSRTEEETRFFIECLTPRIHHVYLVVGQRSIDYDEDDLVWPSGYRRGKYNVSKRLCTRDAETGDYHVEVLC